MAINASSKSVLQRRRGFVTLLQPLIDGFIIIGVAWYFINNKVGYLTQDYVIFMLLLLGMVSVMYDRYAIYRSSSTFSNKIFDLFNAWTITFLALVFLGFLTKQSQEYSRVFIVNTYIVGFLMQCISHYCFRFVSRQFNQRSRTTENVFIIGHGELASYLDQRISSNPWMHQRVLGMVLIREERRVKAREGLDINRSSNSKVLHLNKVSELPDLIEQYDVDTIYVVTPLESSKVLEEMYFELLDKHIAIHWVPDIFSLRLINHSVREIAGVPVMTLSETPLTGINKLTKSIEDRVLSFFILLAFLPLLILITIAIKLDSPGPIFFRQNRTGWNGNAFKIWKFRSMHVDKEVTGSAKVKQAKKDDPRITKVGAYIRKTSLDELPQLFNVLLGNMSLVGPRPHAVQHDKVYAERITDYYARNNIKPGITGLAQVRGYRGETTEIDQMSKRIQSDIEYINNWSVGLDISILVRTVTAFTGKGAY